MTEETNTTMIQLDEFIKVEMQIPKVMDALQFKALMTKANKLFNLAEAPLEVAPKEPKKYAKRIEWTKEMIDVLRKNTDKKPKELAKILNISSEKISNKIHQLKKDGEYYGNISNN